jgi:hypothetical protein
VGAVFYVIGMGAVFVVIGMVVLVGLLIVLVSFCVGNCVIL